MSQAQCLASAQCSFMHPVQLPFCIMRVFYLKPQTTKQPCAEPPHPPHLSFFSTTLLPSSGALAEVAGPPAPKRVCIQGMAVPSEVGELGCPSLARPECKSGIKGTSFTSSSGWRMWLRGVEEHERRQQYSERSEGLWPAAKDSRLCGPEASCVRTFCGLVMRLIDSLFPGLFPPSESWLLLVT